eukprot:4398508-Pyramimonas_sp.AAC.1
MTSPPRWLAAWESTRPSSSRYLGMASFLGGSQVRLDVESLNAFEASEARNMMRASGRKC